MTYDMNTDDCYKLKQVFSDLSFCIISDGFIVKIPFARHLADH